MQPGVHGKLLEGAHSTLGCLSGLKRANKQSRAALSHSPGIPEPGTLSGKELSAVGMMDECCSDKGGRLHLPRSPVLSQQGSALDFGTCAPRCHHQTLAKHFSQELLFLLCLFSACSIQECPSQPSKPDLAFAQLLTRAAPAPPAPRVFCQFFFFPGIFVTGRVKAVFQGGGRTNCLLLFTWFRVIFS